MKCNTFMKNYVVMVYLWKFSMKIYNERTYAQGTEEKIFTSPHQIIYHTMYYFKKMLKIHNL